MDKKVTELYTVVRIAKCSHDEALSISSLTPAERKRLLLKAVLDKVSYLVTQSKPK